jgi:hypothetical protein
VLRDAVAVVIVAGLLFSLVTNALGGGNKRAIREAQADAARLTRQRDSLITEVRRRDERQAALTLQRQTVEADANRYRDSVVVLERRRAAAQLAVRGLRTVGALQDRLRTTFPELGEAAWGLTTVSLGDGDTLGIESLVVPAWFAETFVIDHANAASWRAQKDRLVAVDSLRRTVVALQDSILALQAASTRAYEAGYQAAYAGYQELSGRYVAQLSKPRITLGRSFSLIAAAGAGFLLARTTHE